MKNSKLHTIKKSAFKTPDNYFENFEVALLRDLKNDKNPKSAGFKVPNNYFETFVAPKIDSNTTANTNTKVIRLFSNKALLYAASVAAIAILLISLPDFNTTVNFSSLDNESIENYLLTSDFESSELDNLITDPSAFERTIYNEALSDVSLESYLYNNSDIEDLNLE